MSTAQSENIVSQSVDGVYEGPLLPVIIQMSVPIVIGFLIQVFYNIADTVWISMIDPSNPAIIAGVGLVFPLGMILFAIGNGLQVAMGSVLSRAIGAREDAATQELFAVGLLQALLIGALVLALALIFGEQLLALLGASGELETYALEFFIYSLPGVVPIVLIGTLMGMLQGQGRMTAMMQAVLIGSVVNIVLDPVLIFVFDMGVKGAALATVIAQFIVMAKLLLTLAMEPGELRLKLIPVKGGFSLSKRLSTIGSAQMWIQIIIAGSVLIYNRFVIDVDPMAMAAFTLVGRLDFLIMIPMFGISTALLTIAGQNWGRKNYDRAFAVLRIATILAFVCVLVLALLHILIAPLIYPLFSQVPEVVNYAVLQVRIMELSLPFIAISLCVAEFHQAIGKPAPALMLTIIRHFILSVPVVYVLIYMQQMGIMGVYFGAMSGTFFAAAVAYYMRFRLVSAYSNETSIPAMGDAS
ncbi:putative efflux protein, MATE family [Pseudovibrio denitrificans]|uniref:Putative efflux protein, MATE family n=1 Tax=Pseudovibrio denitrificans TaxID=258256 RepID=A0A1I7DUX1_9HYPH|nr:MULTISPECIES: MATE family efflux transporter [Pseudovibrio]KZK81609.1 Multidrug export protein MepA [Pseudovibrio sp. Ad46]SFU15455.1 putative efflux protein, MATE family [Pseudovibrio denitrificans]